MNFTINRDILLSALNHIQKGLPDKTPLPILYAIKTEVYEDHLKLTSSNSDVAVSVTIDDASLKVSKTGKLAIPGKFLIDIIRKVGSNKIEFALRDEKLLVINADRSEFKLRLHDVDDYPEIDFLDLVKPVRLEPNFLKEIIRQVNFATADNEKRPILTGVNFKKTNNDLIVAATDSYRLSQKSVKLNVEGEFGIVVPRRSLVEISRILDTNNEYVNLYINPNKALFKFDKIMFQTRLLEGNYPDVTRIVPKEFNCEIPFNKEEMLAAVERVSLLSPKDKEANYNIIKLFLRPDHIVELSSNNLDIGDALEEIIPTGNVVGSGISVAFSSKHLLEALRAIDAAEVVLKFAGEAKPFTITANGSKIDLLQLILPVRID
jgi:DNA polymerase-3 subunit beta